MNQCVCLTMTMMDKYPFTQIDCPAIGNTDKRYAIILSRQIVGLTMKIVSDRYLPMYICMTSYSCGSNTPPLLGTGGSCRQLQLGFHPSHLYLIFDIF